MTQHRLGVQIGPLIDVFFGNCKIGLALRSRKIVSDLWDDALMQKFSGGKQPGRLQLSLTQSCMSAQKSVDMLLTSRRLYGLELEVAMLALLRSSMRDEVLAWVES